MSKSTITIDVHLDKDKIPDDITWKAKTTDEDQKAKAMLVAFWDGAEKTALHVDLWTKDMMVDEMAEQLSPKATGEVGKPGLDLRNSNSSVEDLDNSYTITYYPDPSNHNEGFRKINIEIASDVAKNWRAKCSPGYRPRSDSRVVSI